MFSAGWNGLRARIRALTGRDRAIPAGGGGGQALGTAAILVAAAAFVGPWEGLRTSAYLDRIAAPPVWTVCYGETRGVGPQSRFTEAECAAQLLAALAGFHQALLACLPGLAAQPLGVQVALTSWSYNVGSAAACGSGLAARGRAGDWRGACGQLARWNRAGGRVVAGLTRRRAAEESLCLAALAEGRP